MLFCPKCGAILVPKKVDNKNVTACARCGFVNKDTSDAKITEAVRRKSKRLEVVDKTDNEMLPITDAECQKCKNSTAYYWSVQTRAGDEAETKFLKCTRCKHIWREYD
ncbi:transcription factor S [Candidatus Woesearchaeota archaeon CG08_land_8_20_14_0_20_47_9]|nr:MAG: transcription factor S [Candidatus Woesearchaeota archaeon CG1_02_47_18]PIO04486.1 MAG: transcription factor S [Candidatus Woesearchaeota archaeon CG08_land_8_20_14_0_20_47_9]HII30267.1 transcription factor S [Candidatus Woesearchaeota archaeon]